MGCWAGEGEGGGGGDLCEGVATKINRKPVANIVCCEVSVLCSGFSFWIWSGPSSRYGMWMCFPSGKVGSNRIGRIGSYLSRAHGIPGAGTGMAGELKSKSQK